MVDRTSRPLPSCRITKVEPPLGTTIPCPPVGRFSSTPEYAVTSRKVAAIPRTSCLLVQIFPVHQESGAKTSNSSASAEKNARLVFGYRVVNGALCYVHNHRR